MNDPEASDGHALSWPDRPVGVSSVHKDVLEKQLPVSSKFRVLAPRDGLTRK